MTYLELFREGNWRIRSDGPSAWVYHKNCVGAGEGVREDGTYAVIKGESGAECVWCGDKPPSFIQHMWTFVSWCHNQ